MLLDTNVVVWLLLGQRRSIPPDVADALAKPSSAVLVSATSVWEIAIKRSLGKLAIGESWHRVLMRLDLEHLPISAEHAAGVGLLPWHHRDPFDRLLVAQALAEDCLLVTADRTLDAYPPPTWWGGPVPER
ncbi:type II toxin-antitoxin system VapC family toxin [Ornithinimicrobium sp. F0845]|uniref:type II toxin-antitoxin system VapC family toxin n=1 Tax=Ornithinimicrobium sp. F0845 TaxID=2926412 RepID=UPI001FF6336A|nr:type II toxin-antitoxin system VapC family toxin [Ornithinimicrobium sp. F0845]